MKKFAWAIALCFAFASFAKADLIISGVIDGPLSGGTPKAVELYSTMDSADLAGYELEYYFNANATPSVTVDLTGISVNAGEYIWITPNDTEFETFFGFAPTIAGGGSVNGDDSLVLTFNDLAEDTFGQPGTDGTGEPWEYRDGWAYRNDDTGPGAFNVSEWSFSGTDALDGAATNAEASPAFPIGTFTVTAAIPEPTSAALFGLAGLGLCVLRRRS